MARLHAWALPQFDAPDQVSALAALTALDVFVEAAPWVRFLQRLLLVPAASLAA